MELESWWLLTIPLFFGLGWFAARADLRGGPARGGLPDAYFRGLNFLLNEQPDKAIDAFIDVVKLDPETIELHFALGNLFRRRGETDRAIRVHLNLAERRDLEPKQREHALYELGQDFMKAGLLDRAEEAFNRLEGTGYAAASLRHRLDIAQMVRDWPQAIELATRLSRDAAEERGRDLAHFHCEMAAVALSSSSEDRFALAQREIEAAARAAPGHPRPVLLAGTLAHSQGDPARAIRAWEMLASDNAAFLALVAREWLDAHSAVGEPARGIELLAQVQARSPSIDSLAAIADAMRSAQGAKPAIAWVEEQLRHQPSLLGLEKLLALRAETAQGEERDEIELSQRLVKPQAQRLARFVCSRCGFKARQFYWQCPGCAGWDTYAPRRTEEIER